MSDKTARALAITALVFMGIFVVSLPLSIADGALLGGWIEYVAYGSGIVGVLLFVVLKMTGHGFSVTEMNNRAEIERYEKEFEEQSEKDRVKDQTEDETEK